LNINNKSAFFFVLAVAWLLVGCGQSANSPASEPAQSMADFCTKLPRPEYAELTKIPSDSDWFELYQVSPGVIAIYEPNQWQEVISYLIEGSEEALLFDTGNGIADIASLARKLTDKPISVLNSHSHYDHVGGNFAFNKIYGMQTPFTLNRQKGQSNQSIGMEVSAQALCKRAPPGVTETNHVGKAYTITNIVEQGTIIDLGERTLEILHVPGHTPDAIALIDRKAGLMWTGDSFYQGPIWLYADETDLTQYAKSLDKMVNEVPNLVALLPAHNTPWVDPKILIRVQAGFEDMLSGKATSIPQGEGMREYMITNENAFSFLMRDESLPYKKGEP
jgi:glyoxylase-like metal-dependent hydrolase (beta-lactamase superfamily II)